MGCKPTKHKVISQKMASSFREIAVDSEKMLYKDIEKASAHQKLTRAKMKIKILGNLKKQLSK